jgi:hypothetical protein
MVTSVIYGTEAGRIDFFDRNPVIAGRVDLNPSILTFNSYLHKASSSTLYGIAKVQNGDLDR